MEIDESCPELIADMVKLYPSNGPLLCALTQSDVKTNSNRFFIIQLLKHQHNDCFFILTRQGRVGTKGQVSIDCFTDKELAIEKYAEIFKDKTGIEWTERNKHSPQPKKYAYVALSGVDDDPDDDMASATDETKRSTTITISPSVEKIVSYITDERVYQQFLEQYQLDKARMPVGKLHIDQINKGYAILDKLSQCIDSDMNRSTLEQLSSEFYTVIPTKITKLRVIESQDEITNKVELLKTLENIDPKRHYKGDVVDRYLSLGCDIKPLTNSHMINLIHQYFRNTDAGHRHGAKILDIFDLSRPGEGQRFRPLHNRQLLWHGSRTINFSGILYRGLIINPQNAVRTGSMFGNGLYFSNCCSKSLQYSERFMLLCEVSLGNVRPEFMARHVTDVPNSVYHSVHGVGRVTPDPNANVVLEDGVIVPCGKLVTTNNGGTLQYDEFIVYSENQISMKYLIHWGV